MKKKSLFIVLIIIVTMLTSIIFSGCKKNEKPKNIAYATTYSTILENVASTQNYWKEGMIGGNGHIGFLTSGSPYNDTISNQNIDLLMPTDVDRDTVEDLSSNLDYVRQCIIDGFEPETTSTPWKYSYKFHPGHRIRIAQSEGTIKENSYRRWTNYETAEVFVSYEDENGKWERKTFTSRVDDVTITSIKQSSKAKLNLTLSIDDINLMQGFSQTSSNGAGTDESNILFKELSNDSADYLALVAHYPDYENSNFKKGGYAGVTYILTIGGSKKVEKSNPSNPNLNVGDNVAVKVQDADEVYLISTLDRTEQMCEFDEFEAQDSYTLVNDLVAKCKSVATKYTSNNKFSYDKALSPSAKLHKEAYTAASIRIGEDNDGKFLSNEEILEAQRLLDNKTLSNNMVEKVYNQGRYAMICCGGYTMSRLCGMWSDNWSAPWRYIYTMDANVNLQTSGMNTANIPLFGEGYINFVYKQLDDWKENAKKIYGFENAIQAPVNTDGDRALNCDYYIEYPFQYWNAGAAWMIQPIYEFYQCYGNRKVKINGQEKDLCKDVLLEMLTLNANFWIQMCVPQYYVDKDGNACYDDTGNKKSLEDGERYLIVPSYSPENKTDGKYKSTLAVNATMDISAAKDSLYMAIDIENKTKTSGYKDRILQYQGLLEKLPEYQYDNTGALKEWCANGYDDNNNHRHISHLYPAWPAFELDNNKKLQDGVAQALKNRDEKTKRGEATQSHGWLHRGLVGARLGDSSIVEDCLYSMFHSKLHYNSLMTDHDTNRKSNAYCTDAEFGTIGLIDEALLYSNKGVIKVLPAIPSLWDEGEFKNLRARTNASVSCKWTSKKAKITIISDVDQTISVSCFGKTKDVKVKAGKAKSITIRK